MRLFLSLIALTALTLMGCGPDEVSDTYITVNVPAPTIDDLDGELPDEPDVPTPDEEDSEFSQELLEVGFITAFHHNQPFFAQPGEEVIFGTVTLKSYYGGVIDMDTMKIDFGSDPNQSEYYRFGTNSEVPIADYIEECTLRSWPSVIDYTIPNSLNTEGRLVGFLQYQIAGEFSIGLDIICQLSDRVPEDQIGLMAEIPNPTFFSTAYDEQGLEVPIIVSSINGNPPRVAVLIEGGEAI